MTLNIVIPMAGRGQRFVDAGYDLPKPLIPVHGLPMIEGVIANIKPRGPHRFIFLVLADHLESHGLKDKLTAWAPGCSIIPIAQVTEGAACTVLLAQHLIDSEDPLMIANCDQWIDAPIDAFVDAQEQRALDGLIMTMTADDPKWSFAKIDSRGLVTEVAEKKVISNEATVGIYLFKSGHAFVEAAHRMIAADIRVNGEFYVAPVYNEMIAHKAAIGCHSIGAVDDGMYGIGTPADLERFLRHPVSRRFQGNP